MDVAPFELVQGNELIVVERNGNAPLAPLHDLVGEVRAGEVVVDGEGDRALDDVVELTHVARPVVVEEMLPDGRGEADDWLLRLGGEADEEMLREREDVVASSAQRRKCDLDHVET